MSSELHAQYITIYVAVERLRRARQRAEEDYAHWQRRTTLAAANGDLELAQAARQAAALIDERVDVFGKALAMQEQTLVMLEHALALGR